MKRDECFDSETQFGLARARASAMADLLSNAEEGPFEIESGTLMTAGVEIGKAVKEMEANFDRLLKLYRGTHLPKKAAA